MLVYVEFISRRPGVSIEAFHFAAGRGQTGWSDEHSDDVLLLNLGRTFRTGPEPEYLAVWYTPGAGLERMGEWERIFASGAADHLEETFRLAARIDTAGCYEALLEPAQGRDGLYYGEYLDVAPSAGRDEVTSYFSERAQRHDGLTLNLLCDRIGGLGPEPRCLAVWTVPGWDALGDVVRDLDGRRCTRTARARRAVPRSRRRDAVRDPVGVGFVGAGNVLPAYLQVLDRLVPRGLAREGPICARQQETWPELLRRRPAAHLVADADEVFESDVEVVVVLTPPAAHAELTRSALEHGKHVVVEKPFAESRAEGEALSRLASERGLHLLVAPFVQLSPTFRVLWTTVRDGALGHVHSARGLYGNAGSHWTTWYHSGGPGPLGEAGIYNLKSLTALLGPVVEVLAAEALAVPTRHAGGSEIAHPDPDVSHAVLRHAEGALSSVVVEPGDPALPASRARAVRDCRHGEPAR